jgi:hypothetical protein
MNPNIGIKSYQKPHKQAYPSCHVCGKTVRFPATCDNCHEVVCNRHRPAFAKPWYCSKCIEIWQAWAKNNPGDSSGTDALNQAVTAENLYLSKRIVEADKKIEELFLFLTNIE